MLNPVVLMPRRFTAKNIFSPEMVPVSTLGLVPLNELFKLPDGVKLTCLRPSPKTVSGNSHYVNTYIEREKSYRNLWDRILHANEIDPRFVMAVIMKIGLFRDFPLYVLRDLELTPYTQSRFMAATLEYQHVRSFVNKFYLHSVKPVVIRGEYQWTDLMVSVTDPFGDESLNYITERTESLK